MGSACPTRPQIFRPREQLMLRANSLKKAIRQIIEHTEKGNGSLNDQVASTGYSVFPPDVVADKQESTSGATARHPKAHPPSSPHLCLMEGLEGAESGGQGRVGPQLGVNRSLLGGTTPCKGPDLSSCQASGAAWQKQLLAVGVQGPCRGDRGCTRAGGVLKRTSLWRWN